MGCFLVAGAWAVAQSNILINGDFTNGTNAWSCDSHATTLTTMPCLDTQSGNPYLRIDVSDLPFGQARIVSQRVQLPQAATLLTLRTWADLETTTARVYLILDGLTPFPHVLRDTFAPPLLRARSSTWPFETNCTGNVPETNRFNLCAVAGQQVTLVVEVAGSAGAVGLDDVSIAEGPRVWWTGGDGNWSDPAAWSPAPPSEYSTLAITSSVTISVDVPFAHAGVVTLGPESRLLVDGGWNLRGPIDNRGNILVRGTVASFSSGIAFRQSGGLTIEAGGTLSGGGGVLGGVWEDVVFRQTGGDTRVDGGLDWSGSMQIADTRFRIGAGGHVGVLCQAGGNLALDNCLTRVDGSLKVGTRLDVADGEFVISSTGQVGFREGGGGGSGFGLNQWSGRVTINGVLDFPFTSFGGVLDGRGTINGLADIRNAVISPGDGTGELTFTGDLVMVDSELCIELGGTSEDQFDALKVGRMARLSGVLRARVLPTFAPVVGDRFQVLSAETILGEFTTFDLPPGIGITNNQTTVELVVTSTVPVQILSPKLAANELVFSFATAWGRSYSVQCRGDLKPGAWTTLTNFFGTGSLMEFRTPCSTARQMFFRVKQP